MSSTFDAGLGDYSSYPLILHVDAPVSEAKKTHLVDTVRCGRFVVIQKTLANKIFEANEVFVGVLQYEEDLSQE